MKKNNITAAPVGKNDILEITVDDIGCDGEGIAHIEGYTVFIRYALPGEKVRALVIAVKPTFAVAKLQKVLEPSPDRCEPFCKLYYKCGGCNLQHLKYEAQLRFKREILAQAFRKAHVTAEIDATVPSPQIYSYRNKMSLPVRSDPPVWGFFAEGSHRVVPLCECPIQFEGSGELITEFGKFITQNGISGYDETTHSGTVRHLAARSLGGFVTVTAVVNGNSAAQLMPFDKALRALYGDNYAYYINYNTSTGNRILGDRSELIGGREAEAEVDGLRVSVHPHSFFQVNDGVRKLLYEEVSACVQGEKIIDAYSGAGVLSALLSRKAESVTAIEIEPKAVESARDLLRRNGVDRVELVCGDCARELPRMLEKKRASTVVLDPPRAGCAREAILAAVNSRPERIVYVSCNPATLARDAAIISAGGYEIIRTTPFDMFPHGANLETLCVFARADE